MEEGVPVQQEVQMEVPLLQEDHQLWWEHLPVVQQMSSIVRQDSRWKVLVRELYVVQIGSGASRMVGRDTWAQ